MKLICPKCELELRPKRIGVAVEAMAVFGPYELWNADLLVCPTCNAQIAMLAGQPLVEHFRPEYAERVANAKPVARFWANQRERERF
jgi:hypothetical protein